MLPTHPFVICPNNVFRKYFLTPLLVMHPAGEQGNKAIIILDYFIYEDLLQW